MLRPDSASAPAPTRHLPTELLRRYVAGELPAAEEHAVEAHTLACDQCAEVLEGLEMQPAAVQDASLNQLRHRLHARVAELAAEPAPTVVPLWNWRPLAAAAVLLLSLGVVAWLTLRPATRPEIAARATLPTPVTADAGQLPAAAAESAAAPVRPDLAVITPATSDLTAVPSPARRPRARVPARRERSVARVSVPKPPAEDVLADAATVEGQNSDRVMVASEEPRPEEAAADGELRVAGKAPAAKAKMARAAVTSAPLAATAPAEPTRTIQGRVTDTAGQPMPGATVLVPGTQTGTSTAPDGSFSLTVPAATPQLSVSSIGYATQTRALRPTDSTLALALAPNGKQLSEVVVRREAPPMLPSLGAMPTGGFPALRKYLTDSLDYPEKALNEHLEGTVRVQFVVGADGGLSGFKVVRKLSPECDEEALRLLKAGPAWFPAVQNNRRVARKVELNIPFKIEAPR